MDKYTVDLDQVLNDFEYSELTYQQSKSASERSQNPANFQPPLVTKHSINNVFNSLNEYLKSEIGSSTEKVEIQGKKSEGEQQNVGENDNNSYRKSYSEVEGTSKNVGLDVRRNKLENTNNITLGSLGQNEHLIKLKNESQNGEVLKKAQSNNDHEKDIKTLNKLQLDQPEEGNENMNILVQENDSIQKNLQPSSNLLELDDNHSNLNVENFTDPHQEIHTENKSPKETDDESTKTDYKEISLLDLENFEPRVNSELTCTENNIESNVEHINIDEEYDKTSKDKGDTKLDNEQTDSREKESFFDVTECKKDNVNSSESKNVKKNLLEKTEDTLDLIDKKPSDNVNVIKDMENFVIEPAESVYAQGNDSLQEKNNLNAHAVIEPSFVHSNVLENTENSLKLEVTEKSFVGNDNEVQKHIPNNNKLDYKEVFLVPEISENVNTSQENIPELLTNKNPKLKQESVLLDSDENDLSDCTKAKSESIAQTKAVGFLAEIDVDEEELNKMLEELEIEEGSRLDNNINNGTLENMNNETLAAKKQEITVAEIDNENLGVNNLNPSVSDVESGSKTDQSDKEDEAHFTKIGTLEATKDSNNLEKSENMGSQIIECLEIEKPGKSKKNTEKKSKINKKEEIETVPLPKEQSNVKEEQAALVENPQQQPQDHEEDIESIGNKSTITLEKQVSQDSLSRPQDLPLNNELKEENVTRKIDLIGSPGSTPYNNVYINKTIQPKTTQDTDSDYTSSASPTFSDCSTESTSTASTASVDDYPKNPDGAAIVSTKNPGHKNRNSEKSVGKKRHSGRDVHGDTGVGQENIEENAVGLSTENASTTEQNASETTGSGEGETQERISQPMETFLDKSWLGKEAPLWIPDSDAATCLHCDMKFTVLKRRHHCRACGLVLCSKCCNLKSRLEYLDAEARVCNKCYNILNKDSANPSESGHNTSDSGDSPAFRPNPNNPLEYCSTVSPLQQMGTGGVPPPSVMVPVGVLKRKGSNKKSNKSVMFCDGIAPGSDLTHLDQDFNYHPETKTPKSPQKVPEEVRKKDETPSTVPTVKISRNQPKNDEDTGCFIPKSETSLPPTVCVNKIDILYSECSNSPSVVEMLKNEVLVFAINSNLHVQVKLINMNCCISKQAWCFSTDGLINVGSDELVYLIEYIDEESFVPKDVFFHINNIYLDAVKGTSIKELGLSLHNTSNFLDSKNHAGFVYIQPTFQCLENVLKPKEPYLIGILIHRWETPWAKLFPLRLILRLGAEYKYYPSPLISTRHRDSVFVEIGHTIINLLADFRNFTYTLPQIRGLIIHMEDKKTTITIPKNRYDQVMKSIKNSSEHILAFAGNFSANADSHLVCIQDTQGHENCYTTHAINIYNKPRKITGASFIVFNGSLKSTSGLTAKSNIVEDGLMIQIPSEHMDKIRDNLRNMKNHTIACGCINSTSDETVNIVWGENDVDFNCGVTSPVDLYDMKGVPSIRVHNGKDHHHGSRLIRWTEVFIIQNGEENPKNQDPVDISKVSESIAKACCSALVEYLDLLASNNCQKIGIRATLHVENVSYSAGSNGLKLPPIYMLSLDNKLIPVLHRITSNNLGDNSIVLELIFRILNA